MVETNKTSQLMLDKHIDFIVNYGKTHDKYVTDLAVKFLAGSDVVDVY